MSDPSSRFDASISREGKWTVLQFDSEMAQIGESNVQQARDLLEAATQSAVEADPSNLLLDLSGVSFFGSSFIEGMYRAWKAVTAADGEFALSNCSDHCHEVLTVTKLGDLWSIYPSRDDAFASSAE